MFAYDLLSILCLWQLQYIAQYIDKYVDILCNHRSQIWDENDAGTIHHHYNDYHSVIRVIKLNCINESTTPSYLSIVSVDLILSRHKCIIILIL